jgi:hypothetical protein
MSTTVRDNSLLPFFAGLSTAAIVGWFLVPQNPFRTLTQVLFVALIHTILTVTASAIGFGMTSVLLGRNSRGVSSLSISTACWIAPLAVCLRYASVLALPLAVVVAGSVTAAVCIAYGIADDVAQQSQPTDTHPTMFQLLRPAPLSKFLWMSLAALGFQTAMVAAVSREVVSGSVAAGLSTGLIVWKSVNYRTPRLAVRRVRNLVSSWAILAIAFLLSASAFHSKGGGTGNLDTTEKLKGDGDGHFRGIVLLTDRPPEEQHRETLSLPFSPAYTVTSSRIPLKIRFSGEYWFFQFPDFAPPSNAAVMHGVPGEVGFHSTDSRPILMEAHQSLSSAIDLTNFQSIRVEVRNSDSFPGSVAMELVVSDGQNPRTRLSLGKAEVAEKAQTSQAGKIQTLDFDVPAVPGIPAVDRVTFRFLPNRSRWQFSPEISIESITLNPR